MRLEGKTAIVVWDGSGPGNGTAAKFVADQPAVSSRRTRPLAGRAK